MRIAVVLYGQPRDYLTGYEHIMSFVKKQTDCEFDFFYHCWKLNENEEYKHGPWRNFNKNALIYKEKTIEHLKELYNPVSCEIENQNNVMFDDSLYKNTIAFNNTYGLRLSNINNTLFQMYSRNKARNVLKVYLDKTDNQIHYDFTITVRFDLDREVAPNVKLTEMDTSKTYVSNMHLPMKIMPDHFIITPTKTFIEWFKIYEELKDVLNNTQVVEDMRILKEDLNINAEQLIFANYIFHYKNLDNVGYF
jgi:hypothetical protein